MPAKVLIVPINTDLNRGDQALSWESIEIAKSISQETDIYLYKSNHNPDLYKQTDKLGYNYLTRILQHPGRGTSNKNIRQTSFIYFKWGIKAINDILITLLLLSKYKFLNKLSLLFLSKEKKYTYKIFKEIDFVFLKGGGFLHSYGKISNAYVMYYQLFDVFLAHSLGKKVFVLPNSIGPLKNSLAKKIVTNALSKCSFLSVREGASLSFLKHLSFNPYLSPDLGFYLKPSKRDFSEYLKKRGVEIGTKHCIAITLRPYRFDGKKNAKYLYKNYINQFKIVVNRLINSGYHVSLIAHTIGPSAHEDDRIPLLEVYNSFEKNKNLTYLYDNSLDCREIEKIYSYYNLVIGTRFHSVIFAINVNTPAIAISYGGYKAIGIMKDMGLSEYIVPIEETNSDKILFLIEKAFKNNKAVINKILLYKNTLREKRNELIHRLKKEL
ncbi:MAG: hypothetical protein B6D61_05440 [Bacteroidetes bacterium 4484_249]|nr:MAG: hypothetical protein B6D61_05440 [Bacteroidetes bacterium 4484_249]